MQQAAKAQNEAGTSAEAKKAAQTAKRVRQALAKKQAKEAKKLQGYEEKFAAMEQASKLLPTRPSPSCTTLGTQRQDPSPSASRMGSGLALHAVTAEKELLGGNRKRCGHCYVPTR